METTSPVMSITDEQIAEIEALADAARGWQLPDAFLIINSETPSDEWQWCVGAIQDGEQYPVMEVNTWQYDSDAAEDLARYYAAVNRKSILALISRLRAAEAEADEYFAKYQAERARAESYLEMPRALLRSDQLLNECRQQLRAAEMDAARLSYACQEFDGFFHVAKDKYEFALECAEECGREEPNSEDELNGIRRLIDTAMKGEQQ